MEKGVARLNGGLATVSTAPTTATDQEKLFREDKTGGDR
jgi:hypothetical protein